MKNLERTLIRQKVTSSIKLREEVKVRLDELKVRLNKEGETFWSHSDVIEALINYYLSNEEN